jgi:hypothetical protein
MQSTMVSPPAGLKLTFLVSAVGGLGFALSSMAAPDLVATLSGLPGKDLPVYQQAGAEILGYSVASFLSWRASRWDQVRIPIVFGLTFSTLSALGAFYYVVLKGVATSALIAVLIFSAFLAVALGYYLVTLSRREGGSN